MSAAVAQKRKVKAAMRAMLRLLIAQRKYELKQAGLISWDDIQNSPDLSVYAPAQHDHPDHMQRDHAYVLLAQIERNARDEIAQLRADLESAMYELSQQQRETRARLGELATREELARGLDDRAPVQHGHSAQEIAWPPELAQLWAVMQQGKPGQFLKRTKDGWAWGWPDTIVYQQPMSGGMAYIPGPPPGAAQIINAILVEPGVPLLADDSAYIQYESE